MMNPNLGEYGGSDGRAYSENEKAIAESEARRQELLQKAKNSEADEGLAQKIRDEEELQEKLAEDSGRVFGESIH